MPKRELDLSTLFSIVISMEQTAAIDEIEALIRENLTEEEKEKVIDISERSDKISASRSDAIKTILNLITNQTTEK